MRATLSAVPALQIDFEDGFAGDQVVVSAGGRELWRGQDLRTNLSISLAAVAHVEVPEGRPVEVAVSSQGLAASKLVSEPYLRVSIEDGRLVLRGQHDLPLHA